MRNKIEKFKDASTAKIEFIVVNFESNGNEVSFNGTTGELEVQ